MQAMTRGVLPRPPDWLTAAPASHSSRAHPTSPLTQADINAVSPDSSTPSTASGASRSSSAS
eukprot:2427053-Prymnesium_polylepis.1